MTTTEPQILTLHNDAVQHRAPIHWRVVARQELSELWGGSRGLTLLFGFSLFLAALAYLAAADAGINLLDARDSVGIIVQTSMALGTLSALAVSADAISGERERGTLETLLVTPLLRRDLVIGKLIAATSMWAATFLTALPFITVMAQGPGIAADAVMVMLVAGSLVAASVTALGLAISSIALSNRVSLTTAVGVLLVLAAPSRLPAIKPDGLLGLILTRINPVGAGLRFTTEVLVNQRSWVSQWSLIVSPAVSAVVLTAVAVGLSQRIELGDSR